MRLSVVITTYNRCGYALQAVRSIVEQEQPAHEIIVVCDGSTDDTAAQVRTHFPGVQVVEQPNLGRSVARNTGVAHATGEWVGFLDDDDLWHRLKIERSAEYVRQNPDCAALNSHTWFFSDSDTGPAGAFGMKREFIATTLDECHQRAAEVGRPINCFDYLAIKGDSFGLLLERNRGALSGSLVRRETFIRAGGFAPSEAYAEDWHFFLNVARLTEWHTIPEPLGFQRLHAQQSTNDGQVALNIFAAKINAWYGGRAFPHRLGLRETKAALARYARDYRGEVQGFVWGALRAGHFRMAALLYASGRLLLPRLRDRLYVLVPPQITWRLERFILRKHA